MGGGEGGVILGIYIDVGEKYGELILKLIFILLFFFYIKKIKIIFLIFLLFLNFNDNFI